jgi:hypothetical protein
VFEFCFFSVVGSTFAVEFPALFCASSTADGIYFQLYTILQSLMLYSCLLLQMDKSRFLAVK